MGYLGLGDRDRVDTILRKADKIRVLKRREVIGGSECYIIYAETKWGKYKIWIDPKRGYNIAKAEIRREDGDALNYSGYILPPKSRCLNILKSVHFEKIGDVWVPMEADIVTRKRIRQSPTDGHHLEQNRHHKRTEVTLNSDFDAIKAFEPTDIRDGARVRIKDDPNKYTWRNGKIVPGDGSVNEEEKAPKKKESTTKPATPATPAKSAKEKKGDPALGRTVYVVPLAAAIAGN